MVGRSTLLVVLVAAVTGNKDQEGVFVLSVALWTADSGCGRIRLRLNKRASRLLLLLFTGEKIRFNYFLLVAAAAAAAAAVSAVAVSVDDNSSNGSVQCPVVG